MRIDIGGIRLFVDIGGFALVPDGPVLRERPTLLLVHGGPGFDHSIQKSFASRLARFAQVICYDQRGHGRSDRAGPESWTLDDWADDIVRLCDALEISEPVVLGSSFGGIVAQAYAIRHPGHAAKLILHTTTPRFALDRIAAQFEELGGPKARAIAEALWSDPGDPALLEPYLEICMPLYNTVPRDLALTRNWGIVTPDVLTHFYQLGGEGHRFDFRTELRTVRSPTLVLGGVEDPICPIADSDDIAAALPAALCSYRRFENCGHGINWDDPEGFETVIRDFVVE
ncbi:alpha/beta hydrolase [Parasphingopyxis sp.]|uniref:alpha/beta fold hydrolase n=1 Tax=Parasphingopyxis sp. TaxID=1920299 RepID=UPI00260CADA8|nr:alpha/beta hydrolase [Parasphingopyxis sp.]